MQIVTSMLMAMLWLGASSHALLERTGLIHHAEHNHPHDHAPADPSEHADHDAADGKCVRVSASKIFHPPFAKISFVAVLLTNLREQLIVECASSGRAPPARAVFDSSWQFALRTAHPPRAPSILS